LKKLFSHIPIIDMAATGKAVAKIDGQVIFVENAIPGDVVDISVYKRKKNFMEGKAVQYHERSKALVDPTCNYFGMCGGCKWQNIEYQEQLKYKEKQVVENLTRIGKVNISDIQPIVPSPDKYKYRNKLEFTFSNKRWLTWDEIEQGNEKFQNGVGFHMPGQFDKVLDIGECHLQADPSNAIRNFVREYAFKNDYTFYDIRRHNGLLRNLIIRNTTTGDLMVILQVAENDEEKIQNILKAIVEEFPEITSCFYIVNEKMNDSFGDLEPIHFSGKLYITEVMKKPEGDGSVSFRIGPKSFFQTNSNQAQTLYKISYDFAQIKKDELVYDLYTGTGTIANYIAASAKRVIGIEYVEASVEDARENAKLNNYDNLEFFSGDMKDLLTQQFFSIHGKPDVVITDPPRAGMHEDVCKRLLEAEPSRIVYVSCNPATQARDIEWLSSKYKVSNVQPVDMFPHTPHVENVVLLTRIV